MKKKMRRNTIGHNSLNSVLIWQIFLFFVHISFCLCVVPFPQPPLPEMLGSLVLLLCCFVLLILSWKFSFAVRHTKEREPGNVCRRTEILIFLRRVRDATPALFLKNTNVIRDARDLKVPPFLMITFNMHRKSFFTDSGRLSTE